MKKDRNTFFEGTSYLNQSGFQAPNMNIPFQASAYNQAFYAGGFGGNIPTNNLNSPDYSDIESRLSKIERQINRLDIRLNKLENNSFYSTDDLDNTTNVYMV